MLDVQILLIGAVVLVSNTYASDITFKDVTVHGYNMFVHKFKNKISSSNNLADGLTEGIVIDAIEIKDQSVPILYPNCISDIEDLDELTLSNDGITEIRPGALKNLPALRKVVIKGNNFKEVKSGVFNHLPIATMELSANGIEDIDPTAFDNMPELLNINLADNKITRWNPNWFANSPLVTRVSMQNNLISDLPAIAFKNLIGEKHFGQVDLTLNLIFSYNKIQEIRPNTFKGLDKLNNLWLDNNLIANINEDTFKDLHIKDLKLSDNKIRCINDNLEKVLVADSVNLDGNPWNCECLERIKEWSKKENRDIQLFYADMECTTQRIRKKLDSLQNRLDELKSKEDEN